jgi:hypothetical protein
VWAGLLTTVHSKSSSATLDPHPFGWRDMYDVCVRWRQLSEPNDPVWWVDLLPPMQFAEGFGSHTPIQTGQCRTCRYGPHMARAIEIVKGLASKQPGLSQHMRSEILAATDLPSLYEAVRRDFWVTTPCISSEQPGRVFEGADAALPACCCWSPLSAFCFLPLG